MSATPAPIRRHNAVVALAFTAAVGAIVSLSSCGGTSSSHERTVLRAVRSHALFTLDPPGALASRSVGVGSSRDLIENVDNGGFVEKSYYTVDPPLEALVVLVDHAVRVGARIAVVDCNPASPTFRGSFVADGVRHGFGGAAATPNVGGELFESGPAKAPPGASAFVRLSSFPEYEGPGLTPTTSTIVSCTEAEFSDQQLREVLGSSAVFERRSRPS